MARLFNIAHLGKKNETRAPAPGPLRPNVKIEVEPNKISQVQAEPRGSAFLFSYN